MRGISTEDLKVGEHIIIDGVEYLAEEKDVDCCMGCDLRHCGHCHLVPCTGEIILKRVEKQPADTQDKDTLMTNLQLAEWLAKGHGPVKYKDVRAVSISVTFREDKEDVGVDDDVLIRPWGTDEWVKPTVGIYRRDCR